MDDDTPRMLPTPEKAAVIERLQRHVGDRQINRCAGNQNYIMLTIGMAEALADQLDQAADSTGEGPFEAHVVYWMGERSLADAPWPHDTSVVVTPLEVVAARESFDVMLWHVQVHATEVRTFLWLDKKGGHFRVR